MSRLRALALAVATVATVATVTTPGTLVAPAHASSFDIFGVTPRDIGMGGAMTAAVLGYSSLFYNVAALSLEKEHSLALGFQLSVPALNVERDNPDPSSPATVYPETHLGVAFGWVKSFGGIFDNRLALGISVAVPLQRLLRVQGVDPAAPQFYLYQNLQDKLLIHLGAAYRITDWLSLGAGIQILADLTGGARLDLDILAGAFARRSVGVTLEPTIAPFAGIHLAPRLGDGGQLKLGLSFRGSSSLSFDLPVRVTEGDALSLEIGVAQTVLWTPNEISFGMSYTLDKPALTLAFDLTYAMWSAAPDPSPRLSVDIGGRLVAALGLDEALDLSVGAPPLDLGFVDTLIARVGAEWSPSSTLTLRAGYFYRPTPAPPATGSSAYLDNDAHVVSLGVGINFQDPIQTRAAIVALDLAVQATILPRRTVYRTAPDNPGGDLSHGGTVWNTSVAVVHHF